MYNIWQYLTCSRIPGCVSMLSESDFAETKQTQQLALSGPRGVPKATATMYLGPSWPRQWSGCPTFHNYSLLIWDWKVHMNFFTNLQVWSILRYAPWNFWYICNYPDSYPNSYPIHTIVVPIPWQLGFRSGSPKGTAQLVLQGPNRWSPWKPWRCPVWQWPKGTNMWKCWFRAQLGTGILRSSVTLH